MSVIIEMPKCINSKIKSRKILEISNLLILENFSTRNIPTKLLIFVMGSYVYIQHRMYVHM